jgi:copper transport protein
VTLALVVTAGPALAHAELASSSPANEARLTAEPQRVVLVYTENVEIGLSAITVVAPDGKRVASRPLGRLNGGGNTLTARLLPDQAHGTYVLDWRTVASDDGHVTAGGLTFSVGTPTRVLAGSAAEAGGTGGSTATSVALAVLTWLTFAGFALLAGCAAVRLACMPPGGAAAERAMWPAAAGWLTLLVATLAQLFLYGPYAAGQGPAHLLDRSLLGSTLSTHVGHALMVRIGLLALFAVCADWAFRRAAAAKPRGWSAAVVAILAVGIAATWGATSHAASGSLTPVALTVATAHVTAMAVWTGGLFTLGLCLLGRPGTGTWGSGPGADTGESGPALALASGAGRLAADTAVATTAQPAVAEDGEVAGLRVTVTRFSALALASVITLILTGGYLAVREVGSVGALAGTSYGRLVLAKAGGLIIIIAVASRSRRYVRVRLGDGIAGLRRTVLVELAGAAFLLAVAAVLSNTAPPSAGVPGPGTRAAVAPASPDGGGLSPGAAAAENAVRVWLRPMPGSEPAATAGRGRADAERDGCGPPPATRCPSR